MLTGSKLRVPADVKQLAPVRHFVEEQARMLAVEPFAIYDLVLAANEMATNIIVHGYAGQLGEIEVELRRDDGAIEIVLRDHAPPFDPTLAPAGDTTLPLDQRRLGGMGIHVTRQVVDCMIYGASHEGGNELILIKRGVVERDREG